MPVHATMCIKPNRTVFIRLRAHDSPSTSRFISTLRLNSKIIIHHHAEFSPQSPDGNCPPAKSFFIAACASRFYHIYDAATGQAKLSSNLRLSLCQMLCNYALLSASQEKIFTFFLHTGGSGCYSSSRVARYRKM